MHARPAVPRFAAAALLTSLLVSLAGTGCSVSGAGAGAGLTEEKSPAPSEQERAYYDCLAENGVVLENRDDGLLRVDKDHNADAALVGAQGECVALLPDEAPPSPAPAALLAKAKRFSACVRENGFPEYPDADPTTGEADPADDRAAPYRTTEFVTTAEKCSSGDAGDDIAGG